MQIAFRVPYWYWEQLSNEADDLRVSIPTLVVDAIQRVYKPKSPPDLEKS